MVNTTGNIGNVVVEKPVEGLEPSGGNTSLGHLPDVDDINQGFGNIWMQLILLMEKLRDILQTYEQEKQRYGWQISTATLHTKMDSIEEHYKAGVLSGALSILGGTLGLLGTVGATASKVPGLLEKAVSEAAVKQWAPVLASGGDVGQLTSHTLEGTGKAWSSHYTRWGDIEKAKGDFQQQMSGTYQETLTKTVQRARELMQQVLHLGSDMVGLYGQMLQALCNK